MQDIYSGCIVGFSGGADSSALVHYLKDRCERLLAVHINHMIRGDEAFRDEEACRLACEKYGIDFKCVRVDIPNLAKERKKGLEEVARDERYRIFKEILAKMPEYKFIATAHNANDNAETMIFNMARGGGTRGLSGIAPVNGSVVRPLILCSREEIVEYCRVNNIEYVTDSTNEDTVYTRNNIRHNILPLLKEINPLFIDSCTRISDILRQDEEYIGKEADKILRGCEGASLEKECAKALDRAVLTRVLRGLSGEALDYTAISSAIRLIDEWHTGKMINIHNGLTFKIEHSYCTFIKTEETERQEFCIPLNQGVNSVLDYCVCINCELTDSSYKEAGFVKLNGEKIRGDLYARSKMDGDTVKSGGVTKKLKRVFTDKHIPSHKRGRIPIICDDVGVVAVAGVVARDGAFDKKGDIIIRVYEKI